MVSRLSRLQQRILEALAALEPRWTLTGGAALAGLYVGHRETRDLDLFWRERRELGPLVSEVLSVLGRAGLDAVVLRTSPAFAELRVAHGSDVCVVDLVAEPFGAVEAPRVVSLGPVEVLADSPHEILVAKLTALLGRSEIRDLVDVRALVEAGSDLDRALSDAPKKDAGFSAMTLAWVLEQFEVVPTSLAVGMARDEAERLDRFRRDLIDRLLRVSRPGSGPARA